MGFWFKISGSIIKPTRESLADYISYALITLALIGIARVFIGGSEFTQTCSFSQDQVKSRTQSSLTSFLDDSLSSNYPPPTTFKQKIKRFVRDVDVESSKNSDDSESEIFADENDGILDVDSPKITDDFKEKADVDDRNFHRNIAVLETTTQYEIEDDITTTNNTPTLYPNSSTLNTVVVTVVAEYCPKHYQAYFPFILLIEGFLFFLSGVVWVKLPRINGMVTRFYNLVLECYEVKWNKKDLLPVAKPSDISNVQVDASARHEIDFNLTGEQINFLLNKLFHPESSYKSKAEARRLYEKVQITCQQNNSKTELWNIYLFKTTVQCIMWIIFLGLNFGLFVAFQFYVICEEDSIDCPHDTYLRIIWYMGELAVLAFAICSCKTVMWINKYSRIRRNERNVLSFVAACLGCNYKINSGDGLDDKDFMTCRPYHLDSSQVITNDMALMLHLLNESCPYLLPYFIIFTYDEWKNKLHSVCKDRAFLDSAGSDVNLKKSSSKLSRSPKSPLSDASKKSIKFFIASSDSGEENKSLLSEELIPSNSISTVPPKSFKRVSSYIHEPASSRPFLQSPKMTKYHSVAVPHGLSMQKVAEYDKVFVGGCVRPVPKSYKKTISVKPKLTTHESLGNHSYNEVSSEHDKLLP